MTRNILAAAVIAAAFISPACFAGDWTGSGELGLAYARGNADSETANAKVDLKKDDENWLYEVNAAALRASGEVDVVRADGTVDREKVTNASRWELGGKVGYKYTDRMYFFGSGRYDNDDFASYEWQLIVSAGVGYKFVDREGTKLVGEIGPGWRRVQPIDVLVETPPPARFVEADKTSDGIVRGTLSFEHQLTPNTQIVNAFLVESGGGSTFLQNDLGLKVQMSEKLALKTGLQVRHNTEVPAGVDKTDTLITTNIVVGF
jgi:putative salt-induced outer membrane protein